MLDNRDYMRATSYRAPWPAWGRLLVALAAIFVLQTAFEFQSGIRKADWFAHYIRLFALSIDGLKSGHLWQLLTFQFMHGGLWHLLGNSLVIFFFGRSLEQDYGRATFLRVYFTGGVVGGLVQILLGVVSPQFFGGPTIGASAGAFAILTAYCVLDPHRRITLLIFFIPVTIPAWLLMVGQIAFITMGIIAPDPRNIIAHGAHLGGLITGVMWVKYFVRARGWSSIPFLGRISLPKIVFKRRSRTHHAGGRGTLAKRVVVVRSEEIDDSADADFISKRIDPILDKIRKHGIHSLTDHERKILEKGKDRLSGK